MGQAWAGVVPKRSHSRKFSNQQPQGVLFTRADGLLTRNINGYDIADIVCQPCVKEQHQACHHEPHDSGWSICLCNNSRIG